MILAKYTFTISVDEEGKRMIQCEMPPHDLKTKEGLGNLKLEIDNVYTHCVQLYNECDRLLSLIEEGNNSNDLPVEYEKPSTGKQPLVLAKRAKKSGPTE